MIEVCAVMGIIGVFLALAVPHVNNGAFVLNMADQQLLADLRGTRMDALTKGDHFRFRVTAASTYVEERMQLGGGGWSAISPALKSRTLPSGVTFISGVGTTLEFNTRGLLVIPQAAANLKIKDAHTGIGREVTVWPSGQVAQL